MALTIFGGVKKMFVELVVEGFPTRWELFGVIDFWWRSDDRDGLCCL